MNSNSSKVPACIYRSAVAALLFFSFFSTSYAENLTLAWDPNEEPDLSGYIVYRNIGSEIVVRKLTEMGADIVVHDPFVKPWWEL
jgi:hypothetical protein